MTDKNNFDMLPSQPNGSEHPSRGALDDIDEAVARITDADIEDRGSRSNRRKNNEYR